MATTFGQWLKDRLDARGLSQRQLALAVNKTPSHISQIVNDRGGLSPELVGEIADVLGVSRKVALQAWIDSQSDNDEEIEYTQDDPDIPVIVEGYNDLAPQDKELVKGVIERLRNQSRRQSIGGQRADDGDPTRQQEDGA